MTQGIQGKTALITGASRGIGRAIALDLAAQGANIVINYVRNEEAAREVETAVTKLGVRAITLQANVGDPKAVTELVEKSNKELGPLNMVIHSAALGAFKPVHQLKLNQWQLSLDVNAQSFLTLTQKVTPLMEGAGGGSIIAISSLGSTRFIPSYGAIGVSKAALESLVRYLAVELASKKIRINCVSGGLVDTDALNAYPDVASFKKEVLSRTPAGRIGKPEDLAKVVSFLASEKAAWIYGQTIVADGGLSLI